MQFSTGFYKLTHKQQRAIIGLLNSKTILEASRKAKCSESTIYTWLRERAFKQALNECRSLMVEESINSLKGVLSEAINVLVTLLEAENDFVKLRASIEIITFCMRERENELFNERLTELEKVTDRWINRKG